MSGPKMSGRGAAGGLSGALASSSCFLCRKEIPTGAMFNVNGCEGLPDFLLKEGLLPSRRQLIRNGEDVCRFCLADLMQLQELLNKEKEIRREMSQTAQLIKGRVQESGRSAARAEAAGQAEDPEGEDSQELLSESEERDAVAVRKAGRSRPSKSDEDEDDSFSELSSSSSDEDDDDCRVSPPSKSKPRATATATKAGHKSGKKRGPKGGGPFPCEVSGCRAILDKKDALYKHFLRAHNHRPFRCREPSCNAAYSYPQLLTAHMASIHENKGRRPFRCHVAGCGKRFPSALYLQGHRYKVHSGKAVRTCGICGMKLTTLGSLKKHMRRIHSKKQ